MNRTIHELFNLEDRIALVTGGSRGLGLQIAQALGEAGATVILTARNNKDLEAACSMLRERDIVALPVAGNVEDAAQIAQICAATLAEHGRVDILVNNAGATWGCPAEDHPLEAWDKVMNINVRAVFLFSQYLARHSMIPRRYGRILMMSSVRGFRGNMPGHETVAYNTSKAAVINMTRSLAGEWGRYGITVNALAPGWFPSRMTQSTLAAKGKGMITRTPLGRFGGDEDLKGASVLFASDAGRHITGQVLAIDGGESAIG
jgi:NAD(P)-dependent dehydrogenase (short-subunit alcohol dehydrogenase family)